MSENNAVKLPEVIVFAGPNGSGKTTITGMAKTIGEYINADDIKRTTLCTDIEAAQKAEELREKMVSEKKDFTFETVLSTDRNLLLLKKAKEQGYFVRCIYVLTANADINVARVSARQAIGGHGVPEDKIRSRYPKALALLPQLIEVCDILHVYDNTKEPFRIFKKRKDIYFHWENKYWDFDKISNLTGINEYEN
ncbi:zeta toxin family protein [Eubacterium xylanophilum]|uniref:zeta toxin family protein n=1 Tax=Eubacterium xylanophilum TaxID=39497 RepID=UPI0004790D6F|nr:zeta toxin family protein [Eubacterium xylanophilum]